MLGDADGSPAADLSDLSDLSLVKRPDLAVNVASPPPGSPPERGAEIEIGGFFKISCMVVGLDACVYC